MPGFVGNIQIEIIQNTNKQMKILYLNSVIRYKSYSANAFQFGLYSDAQWCVPQQQFIKLNSGVSITVIF